MRVLRIKLSQPSASFTVPEMVNHKMSYPLPSFSTVIGALHNACRYTSYHEMKVSVQGKYSSKQREIYVNHGLIDSLHDDRGNLIWLPEPNSLSTGYILVAKALNGTGNSFKDRITISVSDEEKLSLYISLVKKKEELDAYFEKEIKTRKAEIKAKEKAYKEKYGKEKNKTEESVLELERIKAEREELKRLEGEYNAKKIEEYEEPRSHFRTLTKGPQGWEVLYDVELVIHVLAADEVLDDILRNRNNLTSLGRSEDFVEITEMKLVEITDEFEDEYFLEDGYMIYANLERVENRTYIKHSGRKKILGTVFDICKNYCVENGTRVFNKISCVCTSNIGVDSDSSESGVYLDKNDGKAYLVDLN